MDEPIWGQGGKKKRKIFNPDEEYIFLGKKNKLQKSFFLKSLTQIPATRDLVQSMASLAYFLVAWFSL